MHTAWRPAGSITRLPAALHHAKLGASLRGRKSEVAMRPSDGFYGILCAVCALACLFIAASGAMPSTFAWLSGAFTTLSFCFYTRDRANGPRFDT